MSTELSEYESLSINLGKLAYTMDKAYLRALHTNYAVMPFEQYVDSISSGTLSFRNNVRGFQIKRWVYDSEELIRDGFKNILGLFMNNGHSIALIIRRMPHTVEMFMAVKNELDPGAKAANTAMELCCSSVSGNFPGSLPESVSIDQLENVLDFSRARSVSALCGIPAEKSENYISQGIEKLLNGLVPKTMEESYTCVILAQPLSLTELRSILCSYEDIATALTPFASKEIQTGTSSSKTSGTSQNDTRSIGASDAKTNTHNLGASVSVGMFAGCPFVGGTASVSGSYGYSWGKTHTDTLTDSVTKGVSQSTTDGESFSTSYTYKTYSIFNLLTKLEETIKRIAETQSMGLWRTAAYLFSDNENGSTNAANYLNSIMQGEASYPEPPFINTWYQSGDHDGCSDFANIAAFVRHLTHPVFVNNRNSEILVLHTANVSTSELSNLFSFPRSSVSGVPVIRCAAFGREPQSLSGVPCQLRLGNTYHMFQTEKKPVMIAKKHLTAHTFITGSTGAGKSNTIYGILERLGEDQIPFLVIEPAKGEYKNVFGNRDDVAVYGTNPRLTELLRIDPFSFPPEIHIYEHLDRLAELFNVCWPMYAAMPAVLKDAMERAYRNAGWDLRKSENKYDNRLFPSFSDVLNEIENVMEESQYSADSKGDYKGALSTRVRSLTNGLNGLIFSADEIPAEHLFDRKVIVDLSRVGSVETKSLIMGLLVMKLQEHRMAHAGMNQPLRHITVLEEAHNLLKNTSSQQTNESANLAGKAVEMLTNAIAEMRTYGEGFIIADQAPGLLDEAVIRNTNTKIILRIPAYSDRYLTGKSIGLNDEQIDGLAHLEQGVAAVYQSDWLEAVLCKIDKCELPETLYQYAANDCLRPSLRGKLISQLIHKNWHHLIERMDDSLFTANISAKTKCLLCEYLNSKEEKQQRLCTAVAYELFHGRALFSGLKKDCSEQEQIEFLMSRLDEELSPLPRQYQEVILALLILRQSELTQSMEVERLANHFREYQKGGAGL